MINSVGATGRSYPIDALTRRNTAKDAAQTSGAEAAKPAVASLPPATEPLQVELKQLTGIIFQARDVEQLRSRRVDAATAQAYGLKLPPANPPPQELQEASGFGRIPFHVAKGTPEELTDFLRARVADMREAAQHEAAVSQERSADVRLALDPNTNRKVVLTADHPDFERIRGARAVFNDAAQVLRMMGQNLADFPDVSQS